VSVTTPFYCSQCSSTGRQQSSSQTAIRCHHCHSQTDSGRKLTTQCSKCNRSFHLSCIKMFKYQADSLPGWFCNTCDPIINPPHSSRTSTSNTHPLDSPSFDALIQSLRSHNHPIPKGARPSFASGLSKLINRAIFKRTTGLAASTMLPPLRPVIRSRTQGNFPDQFHEVKNQHIPGI